jgi:hypothetical protein
MEGDITRRLGQRGRERRTEKQKAEQILRAKMGGFWDRDLVMEDECQRIMESIRGEEANKGRNPGMNGGRIWVCCLSCGRIAVLVRQGWVGRKQEQAAKEKNGYVVSVCGSCERRNGEMVREDQGGRIGIDKEMIRASKGFRAVAGECSKMGWEEVEVSSERVVDRRTLVGKHYAGMTIRSVRVEEEGEVEGETRVKVMEYLDVAFI